MKQNMSYFILHPLKIKSDLLLLFFFLLPLFSVGQPDSISLERKEGDMFRATIAAGEWGVDSGRFLIMLIDSDGDNLFEEGGKDVLSIKDYTTAQRISIPLLRKQLFNVYGSTFSIVDFSRRGDFVSIEKYPRKVNTDGLFDTIPDFSQFRSLTGSYLQTLNDIRHKRYRYYYFNIWTTSCKPCLEEAKYLFDFESLNTKVINICGDCDVNKMEEVLEKFPMPGDHFTAPRTELTKLNWAPCYPSSAVYDENGKLKWIGISEPFYSLNRVFMDSITNDQSSILFIGNSYLRDGEIISYFQKLCDRHHRKVKVERSVFNGVFLKDQLNRALDPEQPYPLVSPETNEGPLAVRFLKSQRWDYVAVIPPGRDSEAFAQLRNLTGDSTTIAFLNSFSRILWSYERRNEELIKAYAFAEEVILAFDLKIIDAGGAFEWLVEHCIRDCIPFDSSGHFTDCGNKIIGCLTYQAFFGDLTFSDVLTVFGGEEVNAAECFFEFLEKDIKY